jgi:pentatricopeptide repeat protein
LINEAAKRKNHNLAKRVFDHIAQKSLTPDLFSYTCLLNSCVRSGLVQEAIDCFDKIVSSNFKPNEVTYTTLLRAFCSEEKYFDRAATLLATMRSNGVKPNDRTYATYLRSCYRFGKVEEGDKAFKEMKAAGIKPNDSITNLIIKIWAAGKYLDHALNMIESAEKVRPLDNIFHFSLFCC